MKFQIFTKEIALQPSLLRLQDCGIPSTLNFGIFDSFGIKFSNLNVSKTSFYTNVALESMCSTMSASFPGLFHANANDFPRSKFQLLACQDLQKLCANKNNLY